MKNNKGLSLVELIIAFALLALVGVGAAGLMATGSNLFASSTREVDLQTEAQSVINHLNNFIIDAERGITFTEGTDENVLEVYNVDVVHVVTWNKADKALYYHDRTVTYSGSTPTVGTDSTKELLASNVDNFKVDVSKVATEQNVVVDIKLVYGDRTYTASQDFSLRNDIKANQPLTDYYNDDLVGQINQVTGIEISESLVYCTTGATHGFSARVTGIGYPSQRVRWELQGAADAGTGISDYGILTIAPGETSTVLTVKAISVADESYQASAEVRIISIGSITLTYDSNSAMIGKVLRVYANVNIIAPPGTSIPSEMAQKVRFSLPEDSPEGLEMYQTSSMTNYCELILGTDMEKNQKVMDDFANPSLQYTDINLYVASEFNPEDVFTCSVRVKPSNLNDIDIIGELTANRNSTTELNAKLEAQGITSREIRTTWEITKDAGLGNKVSIDKNTGILTVDKNIDYSREFKIEVTATAAVSNSTKKIETTVTVTIPKVTISIAAPSATIEKGSSERIVFMVHGLKAEKGDIICTSKPSLKNTLMYCTENECVISVGEKETRDLVAVRLMLKENTSISNSFSLYVLSQTDMYNVEGRKNVYAPYYSPAEVGSGKEEKAKNGTKLKYTVADGKTKLTINTAVYYYNEAAVKNGVTGWWMPISNVEGEDYYIPVPGLSADLPNAISVSYKLNYDGHLLTYSEGSSTTYVEVEEADGVKKKFYLSGEAWKISG